MVTSVSRYTDRVNTFVQIANIDTFAGRQSNYVRRMADKVDMYTGRQTKYFRNSHATDKY